MARDIVLYVGTDYIALVSTTVVAKNQVKFSFILYFFGYNFLSHPISMCFLKVKYGIRGTE